MAQCVARLVVACLIASVLAGCGSKPPATAAPPVVAAPPVAPVAAPPAPQESAEVRRFKEAVGEYLAEARAGAKLLTIVPTLDQIAAKSDRVTDLYTRLPAVPAEVDMTGEIANQLRFIQDSFNVGLAAVSQRDRSSRDGFDNLTKCADDLCKTIAGKITASADDVAKRIGL